MRATVRCTRPAVFAGLPFSEVLWLPEGVHSRPSPDPGGAGRAGGQSRPLRLMAAHRMHRVVYCRVFFRCVCSVSNEFRALLLALDQGSMTVWQNDEKLGVMMDFEGTIVARAEGRGGDVSNGNFVFNQKHHRVSPSTAAPARAPQPPGHHKHNHTRNVSEKSLHGNHSVTASFVCSYN